MKLQTQTLANKCYSVQQVGISKTEGKCHEHLVGLTYCLKVQHHLMRCGLQRGLKGIMLKFQRKLFPAQLLALLRLLLSFILFFCTARNAR